MHQRARREWGCEPEEGFSNEELIAEKYRGIRPAFGYPACPDHTEKRTLWELLGADEVGISLTEHFAMNPAASVSGIYLGHPKARYFAVGPIDRDQVEEYARRKDMTVAEAERWLQPNLGYSARRLMQRPRLRDLLPVTVRTFDPEEVTTKSHRETDPRGVGLASQDVEAIWDSVVTFYKAGLHPAIALCIRRRGEIILDRAIGHARGNSPQDPEGTPLVKATPDTLYNFFSGSKSVTAMLIHLLQEEGQAARRRAGRHLHSRVRKASEAQHHDSRRADPSRRDSSDARRGDRSRALVETRGGRSRLLRARAHPPAGQRASLSGGHQRLHSR